MNYAALIQNRKSVRAFREKQVPFQTLEQLKAYYRDGVQRLIPEIGTELYFFGTDAREALEGAAGYHKFLVGAPQYLVLLTESHPQAGLNAGFVMEDLILKLTDLQLDSCWVTFTDSDHVKDALGLESDLQVAAIAAFGYGEKTTRRLRLNIKSMSNIDIIAKRQYFEPKISVRDLVHREQWGSREGLEDAIGFYDDMLWEAFYAASLAPSYLNRQAYGFLLKPGSVTLVSKPDEYNTPIDSDLSLGIVLHHVTAVARDWAGNLRWRFDPEGVDLPEGHRAVASAAL
jgi:hypothetical protein